VNTLPEQIACRAYPVDADADADADAPVHAHAASSAAVGARRGPMLPGGRPWPLASGSRGSGLALLVIGATLLLAAASSRAAVLAAWNFNGPLTGTLQPVQGSGRLDPVGVGISIFASAEVGGGSSDPVVGSPPDYAWQVSGFPQQGTASGSAGIQGLVDTRGHGAISVSFDFRGTAGSARHQQFQYTLDGRTFVDWGEPILATGVDPWSIGRRFDLGTVGAADDNPLFGFRVVSVFAPGTDAYRAVAAASAYSTSGTWRFDMLTVSGEPLDAVAAVVPLPPSALLLGGGLLLLARGAGMRGTRLRPSRPGERGQGTRLLDAARRGAPTPAI